VPKIGVGSFNKENKKCLKISTFLIVLFLGGGLLKEYSLYAFENIDNYGWPLLNTYKETAKLNLAQKYK
jgi:hypothetical protein